jgi:Ni/Co efflux regulator RcnB
MVLGDLLAVAPATAQAGRRSAEVQPVSAQSEAVNDARTRRRPTLGRLALLLAAVLAIGAAGSLAFAAPYHGGGRGGAPHMGAPRMVGPRAPWGGRGPAFPPGRYEGPPNRYGAPPGAGAWAPPGARGYGPAGRWYAPPPVYARPAPAPVARAWRRGAYLPPEYQGYVVQDYGRYHLRRPPYGYSWVQVGNELLLISASTGMIFDVAPAY